MQPRFEQFVREPQYLTNVSLATLEWYKHSFKWLCTDSPTEQELKEAVLRMRDKGLRATGCNSAIRAINAYLHWTVNPNVRCSAESLVSSVILGGIAVSLLRFYSSLRDGRQLGPFTTTNDEDFVLTEGKLRLDRGDE
jgi:hypothetical protein